MRSQRLHTSRRSDHNYLLLQGTETPAKDAALLQNAIELCYVVNQGLFLRVLIRLYQEVFSQTHELDFPQGFIKEGDRRCGISQYICPARSAVYMSVGG